MHNHLVFFWLSDQISDSERMEFEKGLEMLTKIPFVLNGSFGKPADTHRPVVDNSYSYGLAISFQSLIDHDRYQLDPIHRAFVESNSHKWDKVLIYDIET